MHVLFRESHGLEETDLPQDLGQTPGDLVVLSFSDSDLGAFAAGWKRGRDSLPSLRLANLSRLTHPLSVDTWIQQTLSGAKGVLIRLIGGVNYWAYGVEQVSSLARSRGIALALLPADGRPDPALDAASTLPVSTLRRLASLCEAGGAVAAQGALAQLALAAGLYAGPVAGAKSLPAFGFWHPAIGSLRALAVSSEQRLKGTLAQVPTWKEQGVNAAFTSVQGVYFPKDLSAAQIAFWDAQFQRMAAFLLRKSNDMTLPLFLMPIVRFIAPLAAPAAARWRAPDPCCRASSNWNTGPPAFHRAPAGICESSSAAPCPTAAPAGGTAVMPRRP